MKKLLIVLLAIQLGGWALTYATAETECHPPYRSDQFIKGTELGCVIRDILRRLEVLEKK
jgi:hypothetical protein